MGDRTTALKDGYGQSAQVNFTITEDETGSGDTPADLGRNYKHIWMHIADCSNIPASTTMTLLRSSRDAGTMIPVDRDDAPGTAWVSPVLPETGAFSCRLPVAAFSQRLQVVLSANSTGGDTVVTFEGFESGVGYG